MLSSLVPILAVLLAVLAVVVWLVSSRKEVEPKGLGSPRPAGRRDDARAKPSTRPSPRPSPAPISTPAPAPAPASAPAPLSSRLSNPPPTQAIDDDWETSPPDIEITMVGAIPIELLDALRGTTRKADGTPVDDDSVDIEVEEGLADPYSDVPSGAYALILVTGIARSDIGLKRKRNEDLFLVLPEEPLFAVADGMGGYAAGELAAQLAVDTITTAFRSKAFDGTPNKDIPKRGDELVRSIQMANAMVFERAQEDPELKGMGTTLVAARFSPTKRRVYVAHVGDSRAYRVREGKIVQLTIDHTLGELMNVADKTAHYLARAVGVTAAVEVDLMIDEPKAEDYYLLCSDGLTKMVDDETILDIVQREGEIEPKLRRLVETANERGGKDNITVILIHVREPFESARPKPAPS